MRHCMGSIGLFFELLQVSLGNKLELSLNPLEREWRELFIYAKKHALVGISFMAIERLPKIQRPPKPLLMQWYMATQQIKSMNVDLDCKALKVANRFLDDGFSSVILKGQGIAQLYGVGQIENSKLKIENCHPDAQHSTLKAQLSSYRTPGDIDIWLNGSRKEILSYVRKHVPNSVVVYHHADFLKIEGVEVEVHFTPSWMNSPVTNRRLQRFFRESADALFARNDNVDADAKRASVATAEGLSSQRSFSCLPDGEFSFFNSQTVPLFIEGRAEQSEAEGVTSVARRQSYSEIPSPSLAFNRVYILVHIYRHLFHEGIGLRQLMDYYFVLQQGFTEEEREETMQVLRSLKMQRFAGAVMWVLQHVYGMDSRYLLTEPNEREGRFLLNEIMLAGNFGQYDERLQHERGEAALHWGLRKIKRNFRFVRSYPSEVQWSPVFKLWHYFWRKLI